jgi:hypothetical protein
MSGTPPSPPPAGSSGVTKILFFVAALFGLFSTVYGFVWVNFTSTYVLTGLPIFLTGVGGLYHLYFDP